MTRFVTSYVMHHQEGFRVDYSVTLIDTPGFADSSGIDTDAVTIQVYNSTTWGLNVLSTQLGREVMEGLRFLASLPLAGTGQREGGRFSCINKRISSHPITLHRKERVGVV